MRYRDLNNAQKTYVDRYAASRKIDVDTALTHAIVKECIKNMK